MITVYPTRDTEWLNRMVNHPDIAPHVRDDSTPSTIDVSPLADTKSVFLRVDCDGHEAGFAIFIYFGAEKYELHSGMLKAFRGRNTLDAARAVLRWMRDNTPCQEIVTWAFSCARHVVVLVRVLGFTETNRSKWPATVNGQTVDRVNYSISAAVLKGV
jgi:hypothetical protein